MDNKVQNIILKGITVFLIGVGVLLTVWVMRDDNPYPMQPNDQRQWAIKEANEKNLDTKLTEQELSKWINERTDEIVKDKKQTLVDDVSNVIAFSSGLLFIALFLVIGGFVYLLIIDTKKALKILAGIGAFALFMTIIYYSSSNEVPVCISAMDGDVLCEKDLKFTPENWKIASAAISTTLLLIGVTVLAWISGSVMKLFR